MWTSVDGVTLLSMIEVKGRRLIEGCCPERGQAGRQHLICTHLPRPLLQNVIYS